MSKLLKHTETRVVGVSYRNEDGSSRQEIISNLVEGEHVSLEYYEYENEPAYAVIDMLGNQIGNLSRELASVIYNKYDGCYFDAFVLRITGGDNTRYLGCVIDISIYDEIPEFMADTTNDNTVVESASTPTPDSTVTPITNKQPARYLPSKKLCKFYSVIFTIIGVIMFVMALLLMIPAISSGIPLMVAAIFSLFLGSFYKRKYKNYPEN